VSRASCSSFCLSPFSVLSFSSFWFSRNVRLKRTVCSHSQFIPIRPVEVRGRVIEDDGMSYYFPLTFLFSVQVGCMPSFLAISPFHLHSLLYDFFYNEIFEYMIRFLVLMGQPCHRCWF